MPKHGTVAFFVIITMYRIKEGSGFTVYCKFTNNYCKSNRKFLNQIFFYFRHAYVEKLKNAHINLISENLSEQKR